LGLITLAGWREREIKKEDRFLYVGIVDKKTKMELEMEIPAPPSLTTKKLPN
jgi:hypothetical protein